MNWLLIAALLPALHWTEDLDTASLVEKAGVHRIYVADEIRGAWIELGFDAVDDERLRQYTVVSAPSVRRERSVGAATSVPWVEANGWHFLRGVKSVWYAEIPKGRAALSAAEAFSFGVDAVLDVSLDDLASFGEMLRFLQTIEGEPAQTVADIGFVNDGSPEALEAMKLLERRNLLFRTVEQRDPQLDLHVEIGSEEFARSEAANPHEFATQVRQTLTDERRLLRIYGSDVVLGHITKAGGTTRVHLLNYGPRGTVDGLRVRVEGEFSSAQLASFDAEDEAVADVRVREGGTEFTVPRIVTYAVVDLK